MKKFYLLIFLAVTISVGCKKHKYLTDTTRNNSTETPSSANINVRLQNGLSTTMVNASIQNIAYGDVAPGSGTGFRGISTSVENAVCSFLINGQSITAKSASHSCSGGYTGTTEGVSGNYTFLVSETSPGIYALTVSRN